MNFKHIVLPIEKHLKEFDRFYRSRLQTKVALLETIIDYGDSSKGKKLRPAIVFLSAMMLGATINERVMNGAVLTEMLHNATLVHDDVVDDADERRGIKSINALWNNKTAVLVGDYYLAQGLLTAIDNNEFEYLRILSNTVKRMSEGELLALEKSKTIFIDEATYFEIVSNKTASLLATCSEVGAVSANASIEERAKLAEYGEKIGLAFQLQDDVLDYVSNHSIIGKPTGNDIKEKKITLPLIKALNNVDETEKKQIIKLIKQEKITKKDIQFIIDFTIDNGGIDYTKQYASKFAEEAKAAIAEFPEGVAKTALLELSDFVYMRNK